MPKLKFEFYMPERAERTDQAGTLINRAVRLNGVKGINTVTPGPNDTLFENTNGTAQLDLNQLASDTHKFFEPGKRYILTIEAKAVDPVEVPVVSPPST